MAKRQCAICMSNLGQSYLIPGPCSIEHSLAAHAAVCDTCAIDMLQHAISHNRTQVCVHCRCDIMYMMQRGPPSLFAEKYDEILRKLHIDVSAARHLSPGCYSLALVFGQHAPANRIAAQIAGGVARASRLSGTRERRMILSTVVIKLTTSGTVGDWRVCESVAVAFVKAVQMKPLDGGRVRVFVLMWGGGQLQWLEIVVDSRSLSSLFRSLFSPSTTPTDIEELQAGATKAVSAYMKRAYEAHKMPHA